MYGNQQIFIGSSTESLGIAQIIKKQLENDYNCTIWNDNFFELNISTYENLIKKAIAFDFAIFVGGQDDKTISLKRRFRKLSPRDNVYIEFGLYAGILSPARTFFVLDKRCLIASDLKGVSVLLYSDTSDILYCCNQIKEKIEEEKHINRIHLLPSTSLAIGYYKNFLKEVGKSLLTNCNITIDEKVYDIKHFEKILYITIPNSVEEDWKFKSKLFCDDNDLKMIYLPGYVRNIGVYVNHKELNNNKLLLYDIPQTIMVAFEAVDFVVGKEYIGNQDFIIKAKKKECRNFICSLENLINTDPIVKKYVQIKYV